MTCHGFTLELCIDEVQSFATISQWEFSTFVLCQSLASSHIMALNIGPGARKKGKTSVANNGSTASSPSLRSKTPVLVDDSRPGSSMGAPAGNVKVVVRVRGFLPRGKAVNCGLQEVQILIMSQQRLKEELNV